MRLLANLRELDLSINSLTGSIPTALGNLNNLEKVYIADNYGLTGCIPLGWTDVADNDFEYSGLKLCE